MKDISQDAKITQEQFVFFEKRLWENSKLIESKLMKSIFFFVATSVVWFIIKSATINKLTFFGLEFEELSVPLLMLPPIASYFYYSIHCNVALSSLISGVLEEYYSKKIPQFCEMGLNKLIMSPTLLNIEDALLEMTKDNMLLKKFNDVWLTIVIFTFLILPIPILLWMSYSMLTFNVMGIWSIMSSALVLFLIGRSILIFYNGWILNT